MNELQQLKFRTDEIINRSPINHPNWTEYSAEIGFKWQHVASMLDTLQTDRSVTAESRTVIESRLQDLLLDITAMVSELESA